MHQFNRLKAEHHLIKTHKSLRVSNITCVTDLKRSRTQTRPAALVNESVSFTFI